MTIQSRFFFHIGLLWYSCYGKYYMRRNISYKSIIYLLGILLKNCRGGTKNLVGSVCALKKVFLHLMYRVDISIYIDSSFVINLFFSFGMILLIMITIESWSVYSVPLKLKLQSISKQFSFLEWPLAVCRGIDVTSIDRPTLCLVRFSIVTPKGCPYYW